MKGRTYVLLFWFPFSFTDTLYDVFMNIRDDEAEHCKTMKACQSPGNLRSPHSLAEDAIEDKPEFIVSKETVMKEL